MNFLLENIFKFKSIIQFKDESFSVEIPKINPSGAEQPGKNLNNLSGQGSPSGSGANAGGLPP